MKSLKEINILGKCYSIVPCSEKYGNSEVLGQCVYWSQFIFLNHLLKKDNTLETLLHEVIHALEGEFKLNLKENQVRTLSVAMYSVLKENPDIWKMIWRKR